MTENAEINRYNDKKTGMFIEGNPGKPKGIRHMSTLLQEAIKKVAKGDAEPADIMIVKKLIDKAKQGNDKSVEMVFDRLEGKAPQKIDITSNEETIGNSSEIKAITEKLNELYKGN